jgi:organic radical activating enzyme
MKEAKISEIFMSLQGEGMYAGARQIFVRFHGCNLECVFCDTKCREYASYTQEALLGKIDEYTGPYHSISLTGGEPLLQIDFLEGFVRELKRKNKRIYLETNGTLPNALSRIVDSVDIISMDIKLPSSMASENEYWEEHERFLSVAKDKKLFIKAVVTSGTSKEDIIRMKDMVDKAGRNIPVVLQPVTYPGGEVERIANVAKFADSLKGSVERVEIIPQIHKITGVK